MSAATRRARSKPRRRPGTQGARPARHLPPPHFGLHRSSPSPRSLRQKSNIAGLSRFRRVAGDREHARTQRLPNTRHSFRHNAGPRRGAAAQEGKRNATGGPLRRQPSGRPMSDRPLRVDPAERLGAALGRGRRGAPRQGRRPSMSGRRQRLSRSLLRLVVLLVLWAAILGCGTLGYFALTLPDTSQLGAAQRRPAITILAEDGSTLANLGDLFGQPLTLKEMSPYLPQAVIATEDRRFYSHFGVDPIGLVRAAVTNFRARHIVQGGSTITQQLAKVLFLTPERSLPRKIRETLLALWLEHRFTKNQILEIYLNRVYLGAGTYGVDAAAHRYFGQSAAQLSLFERAVIAGLLKSPRRFSPANDRDRALGRTAQVLDNMVDAGFIASADAVAAAKQGSQLAVLGRPGSRYFADWVADQVREFAGAGDRDLTIRTTLDPRLQAAAEAAIADVLSRYGQKYAVGQGALVALSSDGAVRAMVGGRDYGQSQFNRATQAQRQPGSAFKPFVYLAGLEAGLRPADHFVDAPIRVGNWQPHNYTNRYQGDMTLAEGLAQSINTIAVQVAERAGIARVIAAANWLGNDDNSPMNRVTGGALPAFTWRNFMMAATNGVPAKPLPSAPAATESPLDRLLGWLSPSAPSSTPLVPETWRYPSPQRDGGE